MFIYKLGTATHLRPVSDGWEGRVGGGRRRERDARVCKAKPPKLRGRVTWKLGGRVGGVGSHRDKWFLMTEALLSRLVSPFFLLLICVPQTQANGSTIHAFRSSYSLTPSSSFLLLLRRGVIVRYHYGADGETFSVHSNQTCQPLRWPTRGETMETWPVVRHEKHLHVWAVTLEQKNKKSIGTLYA